MKVGMIFECGQIGADGKVYPYLARKIRPELEIKPFFLDSKGKLIQECGKAAEGLLKIDKCEKVVIIWDLRPPWERKEKSGERLCPVKDCNLIHSGLMNSLTDQQRENVRLLCIVQELETLLLVDEQALSQYLSRLVKHNCTVRPIAHPERRTKPKDVLRQIFEEQRCKPYNDLKDAEKLIELIDINKLRHCRVFQKFEKRIREL